MRLPGRAWLQFEVDGDGHGSRIRQTAIFDPVGLAGLLYWYGLLPLHKRVFEGMLEGIRSARASETGRAAAAMMRTAVVLFTRDLRAHDHPALAAATRDCDRVVPLFVLDRRLLDGEHRSAPPFCARGWRSCARRSGSSSQTATRSRRRPASARTPST